MWRGPSASRSRRTATAAYRVLEQRLRLWSRREIASTSDPAVMELVAATTRETLGDILSYCLSASADDPAATELFATVLLEWKDVGSLERTAARRGRRRAVGATIGTCSTGCASLQAESLRQPRGTAEAEQTAHQLGIAEAAAFGQDLRIADAGRGASPALCRDPGHLRSG